MVTSKVIFSSRFPPYCNTLVKCQSANLSLALFRSIIMISESSFENSEFLILKEDSFHAVGQVGPQVQVLPAVVYLTNIHIYVEPTFEVEMTRKLAIADITGFSDSIVSDCPVLDVTCAESGQTVHLFIHDETRKRSFRAIVQQLVSSCLSGQSACDRVAIQLRRAVKNCATLQEFYELVAEKGVLNVESAASPENSDRSHASRVRLARGLAPCAFFADCVETSPHLLFTALVLLAGVLSRVLHHVSFGSFVSANFLVLVVIFGIRRIAGGRGPEKLAGDDAESAVREFLVATDEFASCVDERLLWGNPSKTLEVAALLLSLVLLFAFFDPAFLLLVSLVGLAFFDRWNPFGLGSLSTILSHLILW